MALDDRYAIAAVTAQALAAVLQAAATRVPLSGADGFTIKRTVYTVSALLAPAVRTAPDVAAIGGVLAASAGIVRAAAASPRDAAPVLYEAARASFAAAPSFASPARSRAARLGAMLAECLEATWLGEAFVAEANTAFGDRQSALAARARIGGAMDTALDRIAAATGQAVVDILGTVARTASGHIATQAADLRPVVSVTTARSAPSSALAYDLYGDPSRAIELVARNRCGTPLFMPTAVQALAPDA